MGKRLATLRRALVVARAARASRKMRSARDDNARRAARERLAEILADARGISMKVGQLLASEAVSDPLGRLVRGVPPLPFSEVLPILEAGLPRPATDIFEEISPVGIAASLGQVHRAKLRGGEMVAVKIRYPDIVGAVDAELRLAGLLPSMGPVKKWAFDLEGYKRLLSSNMNRELDYRSEAARQQRFHEHLDVKGLVIPGVRADLCGEEVMVTDWVEGVHLDQASAWPLADRLALGRTLLSTLFVSLFDLGEVHADPNLGNYLALSGPPEARLAMLDFGCTTEVGELAREALLKLIATHREGWSLRYLDAYAAMGFEPEKLEPIAEALPALTDALFAPFGAESRFELAKWELGAACESLLGDLRWWFRSAGPPHLLLLLRAFQGLTRQLALLDVHLAWWPVLKHALGGERIDRALALELPSTPDSPASPRAPARAKLLRVTIRGGDREPLTVALPAREALRLESILPPQAASRLRASGTPADAISNRLKREGLHPQLLYLQQREGDEVRVWLE